MRDRQVLKEEQRVLPLRLENIPEDMAGILLADVRIPIETFRKEAFEVNTARIKNGTVKGYRIALIDRKDDMLPAGVLFAFQKRGICLVIVEDIVFDPF